MFVTSVYGVLCNKSVSKSASSAAAVDIVSAADASSVADASSAAANEDASSAAAEYASSAGEEAFIHQATAAVMYLQLLLLLLNDVLLQFHHLLL